jgi:hypothetical protein
MSSRRNEGIAMTKAISRSTVLRGLSGSILAGVLLAGCAGIQQPLQSDLASPSAEVQQCAAWFAKLDGAVDQAGMRDAEAYAVPGFPYLRVNRFLASFRSQAQTDPALFAVWEGRLRDLDARSRGYELSNLPEPSLLQLGVKDRAEAASVTERCASTLMRQDANTASRQAFLLQQAQVPDDYADWKRAVGLYPLVRIPFYQFAKGWQSEAETLFQQAAAGTAEQHNMLRYRPGTSSADNAKVARIFASTKSDALGVPQFSPRDADALLAAFAPVYEIDTTDTFDQPGALRWGKSETPDVDIDRPTVYSRIAFTRYGNRTLAQMVYLVWFSERPEAGWTDWVAGKLDGLIFRVTVDASGRPLVYDTIHPCGCYHMFFPTAAAIPVPPPSGGEEWAFIPRNAPVVAAPQRMVLRLTSRSHYLTDIRPGPANVGTPYAMVDDSILRMLPTASGTKSIFGPTGIVPGTQRGERMFTWPLGIEDAGAMREWGRHATALVGRRHFDDADLIEKRFQIPSLTGGS